MTDNVLTTIIEPEQIETLVASAGVEMTQTILDAFWTSNQEILVNLQSQLAGGDLDEAAKSAHALKGSAANLGAVVLAEQARLLEIACQAMEAPSAREVMEAIPDSISRTRAAFETLLQVA
jgi:HPt (histidine-containing phosphotransfer) domain-containing protein